VDSKLMLCQTTLEEVESQLTTLISNADAEADTGLRLRVANALSHVRQAIRALGTESQTKGHRVGGS